MVELEKLLVQEKALTPALENHLLELGSGSFQELISVMNKIKGAEYEEWQYNASILAAKFLAKIYNQRSIEPMLELLSDLEPDEWAYDDLFKIISDIGIRNLDFSIELYSSTESQRVKECICIFLGESRLKDERIFQILIDQLEADYGLAPGFLSKYADKRAIPLLIKKFDNYVLKDDLLNNLDFNELVHAIEALGGTFSDDQKTKILKADDFRVGIANKLSGLGMPKRVKKIGRNEPCPCGSGLKHKKCCLKLN